MNQLHRLILLSTILIPVLSTASTESCKFVIVGAGIGGLYTAWRLSVDTNTLPGTSICIFEAKTRPGGRILSIKDPIPGFEGYTLDLGCYRYHRNIHRHTRLLTESALGIPTQCYSNPLQPEADCPDVPFNIASTRGTVYGISPNGSTAGSQLASFGDHVPYRIPSAFQWGPGKPLDAPRDPSDFLSGNDSVVPEIGSRWTELNNAEDYETAMRVADEILFAMRNGTYNGVPYTDVSMLQVAVREGMTDEEIAFFFEANAGVGGNANLRQNLDQRAQLLLREIALQKSADGGFNAMVNPVEVREGVQRRSGMKTILDRMIQQIEQAGVKIQYDAKVVGVRKVDNGSGMMKVRLQNGTEVISGNVVLNIGKPDLLSLGTGSEPLHSSPLSFRRSVERTFVQGLAKTYCFWEDAWWLTKLKLRSGRSRTQETAYSMRYHDGHVTCKNSTTLSDCRGAMLVSYTFGDPTGLSTAIWAHTHNSEPYTPITNTDNGRVLVPGNMSGPDRLFFDDLHTQIRRVHNSSLRAFGHDVNEAIPEAAGCIYADWHDVGTHDHMGPGKGTTEMYREFIQPVSGLNLSLVNEAWGQVSGWAEASLQSAERMLFHLYGVKRPGWMDEPFHASVIESFNEGRL